MKDIFFWKSWSLFSQILYLCFLFVLVIFMGVYVYSQLAGLNYALGWEIVTETNSFQTIVDTFHKGFFEFNVDALLYYLVQAYEGTEYFLPPFWYSIFFGLIGLTLLAASTAITYVKGLWYFVGLSLLGVYVYFLHFEILEVGGVNPMYWPIGIFLVLGFTIHFFHDFRPGATLAIRYCTFLVLVTIMLWGSTIISNVEDPVYNLVAYGWLAPFSLSLVYIFLVSSEIYQFFLYVATDSKHAKPSSSLINFMIMSFVYLGNVVLTFLKNRHSIDWDIFYLDAPFLLLISSVLGVWGNKKKEVIYKVVADFSPSTAIWHLVMAITCFGTYAYANLSGNDALQEVMEDAVIFTQITTGIMFLLFILANFWGYMSMNLPVHVVVYLPRFMPFGFVRVISLIGIFAIVLYNSDYQYRQAMSGYYTEIGGLYLKQENYLLANEYYLSALDQDQGGHKANYSMAMLLKKTHQDDVLVKSYLKKACFKNATPQAYASLGNYFLKERDIIRSLEASREGKSKFPSSPEILNNFALAFGHTNIIDSTFYYLKEARKNAAGKPIPAANQLAFCLKYRLPIEASDLLEQEDDMAYRANALAFSKTNNQGSNENFELRLLSDTSLNQEEAAYVINMAIFSLKDTNSFKAPWLDTLLNKSGNEGYFEQLQLVKAMSEYYGGKVAMGVVNLDQLLAAGNGGVRYNYLMSNWLLQQDASRMAMDFLSRARQAGDLNSAFGMAIASSFYLPANEAIGYWQNPLIRSDSTFYKMALRLSDKTPNVFRLGILPQFIHSASDLSSLYSKLPANNDKNKALGRILNELNNRGESNLVISLYEKSDKTTSSEWEYLKALRALGRRNAIVPLTFASNLPSALYLKAWSLEISEAKKAEKTYRIALLIAPFYEQGIQDAVAFLKGKWTQQELYNLLLNSVMLNPYSVPLQQAYAKLCVEMNLFGFADYTTEKLKDMMHSKDYVLFMKEIAQLKEEATDKIVWK